MHNKAICKPSRFTIATIDPVTALCVYYNDFRAILSKGGQWDAFALAHAE